MNNTQISEDRHPSRDREIAEQIASVLRHHPGIPRESVYLRLRGSTKDSELAAARRSVLVETMKDLLRSGAIVEARVGQQALLYLKGEQPAGAAVYQLHQPPLKVWVDPNLKGTHEPTGRVVDKSTVTPIPKERDDLPVRSVAKVSASTPIVPEPESIVPEPKEIAPAPQSKPAENPPKRSRDLSAFPSARCTVSANMLASEAAPFFRIMERRKTTPSKFLRQMIVDFVAKEEGRPIVPAAAPEVTPESLIADVQRAQERLYTFLLTGSLPKI